MPGEDHLGLVANGKSTSYSAAKGGVVMLSRAAAAEYGRENIRVNCSLPFIVHPPSAGIGRNRTMDVRTERTQKMMVGGAASAPG